MTEPVTIDLSDADVATLREWAGNAETALESLLQDAVQEYMARQRDWIASIEEAEKGPFYSIEEVRAHLAERRRDDPRMQAAE